MSMNFLINMKATVKKGMEPVLLEAIKSNCLLDGCPSTFDEALKDILKGNYPKTSYDINKDGEISAEFDACHSYEPDIIMFFKDIAKYLEDGSYMEMFPDNAWCKYIVTNGDLVEYDEDDAIRPCIESGEELYDMTTCSCPLDYYNAKTGYFVTKYNDDDDIIVYKLSKDKARECAKFAREHNESWLANLGPDGQIVSADDAVEFLDSIMVDGAEEDWLLAGKYTDLYALNN